MLLALILLISSLTLLSSCAPTTGRTVPDTEYVFFIPNKVPMPEKPVFEAYDPAVGMDHTRNFTKWQRNTLRATEYTNTLRGICDFYQKEITDLELKKQEMESQQKK